MSNPYSFLCNKQNSDCILCPICCTYTVLLFSSMGIRCLNFIAKFKPSKIPALWDIMTCRLQTDTLMANVPSSSGLSSSFQIIWISSYTSERVFYFYSLILWKFINTLFSGKLFYFCTLSTYQTQFQLLILYVVTYSCVLQLIRIYSLWI